MNEAARQLAGTAPRQRQALRLWLRLLSCANLIEQRIRSRLRREFAITLPQFDVLSELERAGTAQSMSELSAQLMVSNGNVTGVVERLVRAGLVERTPSPNDRRVQYVGLTRGGAARFRQMAAAHARWVSELLEGLSPEEMRRLSDQLKRVRDLAGSRSHGSSRW